MYDDILLSFDKGNSLVADAEQTLALLGVAYRRCRLTGRILRYREGRSAPVPVITVRRTD